MSEETIWFPSLEEYNPNISKEKWLEILDNRNLTTEQNLHVLACIYNFGGEATCTQLAQKYGETKNTYNSGSSNYAKNLVKAKICNEPPLRDNGNSRWWPVLYVGHNADEDIPGSYVWKLRDELKEACKEYNIEKWLNVPTTALVEKKSISKKIWKLSHGKDFSEEDVQYYLDESTVCVHKNTAAKGVSSLPQGKAFTDEARTGDLFYLCRGNQEIILIGEFISNEIEIDNDGWAYRKYKMLYSSIKKGSYTGPNKWWTPNNNSTFIEIKKSEYSDFENLILIPFFGINLQALNLVTGDNLMNDNIEKYKELLTENKNIILHGAPGTGKTFLAKQIAEAMGCSKSEIGFCQFHPSYDYTDFVEGLRPTKNDDGLVGFERRDGVFKDFCKMAINFTNKEHDFNTDNFDEAWKNLLEHIRFEMAEGRLVEIGNWEYSLSKADSLKYQSVGTKSNYSFTITKENVYLAYQHKKGRPSGYFQKEMEDVVMFMKKQFGLNEFYEKNAENVEKKNYVFIIDEINRGELSKIFGELFFSIDPGYRGEEGRVNTQYQNLIEDDLFKDGFYIPENVYIIGTMNDIDRSVESMDFAMRRRFTFVEVTAAASADNMQLPQDVKDRMKRINDQISKTEGLNSAYHIGGAYFRGVRDFEKLWNLKLSSLVKEYLRGMDDDDSKYKKIKNAYFDELESVDAAGTDSGATIED